MSTDAFTQAARAEAERKWPYSANPDPTPAEDEDAALNAGFMAGAEWARTYLAEQEVSDAEVEAAGLAVSAVDDNGCFFCTPGDTPCELCTKYARAALTAARAVGRDAR